jgi:recombination protein RecT
MAVAGRGNQELKNQLQAQTQIQPQGGGFQAMIQQEFKKIFPAVQSMVPKHMTPERLMRVSLAAISRTPKLASCTPESIVGAVTACAVMGLEPNLIGHAYLVPFWNNSTRSFEAQFVIGYKGAIELVRRTGEVSKINAIDVYENDFFYYEFGDSEKLIHVPLEMVEIKAAMDSKFAEYVKGYPRYINGIPSERGNIVGHYSTYQLKDGSSGFYSMTSKEALAYAKKFSKSKTKSGELFGPWVDHFDSMAKKTCIKEMVKYMPISIEIQESLAKDEAVIKPNNNPTGMNDVDMFSVDYSVVAQIDEPDSEELKADSADTSKEDLFKGTPFEIKK